MAGRPRPPSCSPLTSRPSLARVGPLASVRGHTRPSVSRRPCPRGCRSARLVPGSRVLPLAAPGAAEGRRPERPRPEQARWSPGATWPGPAAPHRPSRPRGSPLPGRTHIPRSCPRPRAGKQSASAPPGDGAAAQACAALAPAPSAPPPGRGSPGPRRGWAAGARQRAARGGKEKGETRSDGALRSPAAEPDPSLPYRPAAAAGRAARLCARSPPATPARKRFLTVPSPLPPLLCLPRGSFRPLSAFEKKKKKGNLRALLFHQSRLLLTLWCSANKRQTHTSFSENEPLSLPGAKMSGKRVAVGVSLNAKHQRGM